MFKIMYVKDGEQYENEYKPDTLSEANGVKRELLRDFVADKAWVEFVDPDSE